MKKGPKRGEKKPAWATTEKQQEEQKEAEIDDLLEFAYELDYEKYMEDFEVRQALEVIKQRVAEMKKEKDWQEDLAKEWNEANKEPSGGAAPADDKSQVSYGKSSHYFC